jgi:hypothetical protein
LDQRLIGVRQDRKNNYSREVGLATPDFVALPAAATIAAVFSAFSIYMFIVTVLFGVIFSQSAEHE